MHNCPCCGQPVYSEGYGVCFGCRHDCDPAETWHCDGRNGHSCDGTACDHYEPGHMINYGKEDKEYWSEKDR